MQRQARVVEILSQRKDFVTARAQIVAAPTGAKQLREGETVRIAVLPDLVGAVHVGTEVRIDCAALAKSLGTGGYATTIATQSLPADTLPAVGHVMKARYLPHQHMVMAVEEADSPYRSQLEACEDLAGMPVVVADLHSALTPLLAALRAQRPGTRVAYIHDDSAALPMALSQTVARLREVGWLSSTITAGQSFGGDYEAVSIPSALIAARAVAKAQVCVVAPGPGVMGTGTKWGFSGTAAAAAWHAAASLGGTPVAVLRGSSGDQRASHRGISHHSLSVLTTLLHCSVTVADLHLEPGFAAQLGIPKEILDKLATQRSALGRHHLRAADAPTIWQALQHTPVPLVTMGRGLAADPLAFLLAGAGGAVAADLLDG